MISTLREPVQQQFISYVPYAIRREFLKSETVISIDKGLSLVELDSTWSGHMPLIVIRQPKSEPSESAT